MTKKQKPSEPGTLKKDLDTFFSGPLAERAGSFLSERAVIALYVDGKPFVFQRKKGKNSLEPTEAKAADISFWVPLGAMHHLLSLASLSGTGLGTMGVAVIECLFHSDPEKKVTFKLRTGFLGLWSKGYFSVLKAGGPEVASYLGKWGYGSLARIKEVLRKFRGEDAV